MNSSKRLLGNRRSARQARGAAVVVALISVCGASASLRADPFRFLSYEAGAGLAGVTGEGFRASSGNFFKSPFNDRTGTPCASKISSFPELEFESYFTIDSFGPTAATAPGSASTRIYYGDYPSEWVQANCLSDCNPPDPPSCDSCFECSTKTFGLVVATGSNFFKPELPQIAVGIYPQPFLSGIAPSGHDGVFIARLTVARGELVVGGGLFAISSSSAIHYAEVAVNGAAGIFDSQAIALTAYLVAQPDLTAQGFGLADTYDIWFEVDPPPLIVLEPARQVVSLG